jgi:hypothetical protein
MPTTSKTPNSFADGINAAMQDIAGAMTAPDADLHFGTEMIKVMGVFLQHKHNPQGPNGQGPAGSAGAPGGGPGSGPGAAGNTPPPGDGGGSPPGMSQPGGPAGGGAQNPQMPSVQPPSGPSQPGSGPTPGLTPNPDELRRVLQEVAGQ